MTAYIVMGIATVAVLALGGIVVYEQYQEAKHKPQ